MTLVVPPLLGDWPMHDAAKRTLARVVASLLWYSPVWTIPFAVITVALPAWATRTFSTKQLLGPFSPRASIGISSVPDSLDLRLKAYFSSSTLFSI